MTISFSKLLGAPMDWLVQLAGSQCARRKVPRLTVGRSQPLEKRMELLSSWLDALHARDVFNGTVLIAKDGRICFEAHYGFADVAGLTPLSNRSSFSLASVSKQFTATGIMLLARKGKLTLQDKVAQHIPELAIYREITIRQLLHHTSGMPDHMALAEKYWDPGTILTTSDMIALYREHRPPLDFAPGEKFEYGNAGYVLLGEIISRASGRSYAEFMAAEIFKPLGMNDSAAFNLTSKECPLQARVYGFRKRFVCFGKKVSCDLNYLDGVFGDGGI